MGKVLGGNPGEGILGFDLDEGLPLKPQTPYLCLRVIFGRKRYPLLGVLSTFWKNKAMFRDIFLLKMGPMLRDFL